MTVSDLDPFKERRREERRRDKEAARAFVRVCAEGDADLLYDAAAWLDNEGVDAWRLAMTGIAKLPRVSADIQMYFVPIWVRHKHLPRRVGNRRVVASALRLLLPGDYSGPPLTLYRGTNMNERRRRLYGFSWSTDPPIARVFAEKWAQPDLDSHGVVLQTLAPPQAILLVRPRDDSSDDYEGEVVVDPFRLGKVTIHEKLT